MDRCLLLFPTTAGALSSLRFKSKLQQVSRYLLEPLCRHKLQNFTFFQDTRRELCTLRTRHNRSGSCTSNSPDADASRPVAGAAGTPVTTNRLDTSGTAHQLTHRQISGPARPAALPICVLICNQHEGAFSRGACSFSCVLNASGAGTWVSTTLYGTMWVSTMLLVLP